MNDDALNRALAELPHEAASPDFTRRVLASLGEAPSPPWRRSGLRFAMAAAVLALLLPWGWQQGRQRQRRDRLSELRLEQQQLAAELEAIKHQAEAGEVLYLGGDEGTDIVMNLSRLAARRAQLTAAGYRAASTTPGRGY